MMKQFHVQDNAFRWTNAAAAGRNADHYAAADKMGKARHRRRSSGLGTPPPTLTWSAHRPT